MGEPASPAPLPVRRDRPDGHDLGRSRRERSRLRRFGLTIAAAVMAALCLAPANASAAVSFVGSNVDSGTAMFFGTATATVLVPNGTANGDLMIATVSAASGGTWAGNSYTAAAGWTLLDSDVTTSTLAIYYRVASSEPASYSWSYAYPGGGSGASTVAQIDVYTGVASSNPINAGNSSTGSGTAVSLPNDTATMAGSMRVSSVASYRTSTTASSSTFSAGLTLNNQISATTGQAANVAAAREAQAAGTTASRTNTLSSSVTKWLAGTYVINPVGPTKLAFTTQPVGGVTEGVAFSTQPKVTVQFATSATATTDTSTVTLAIASGPAGGVLTCTGGLSVAAVAGVASFAGCQITGTAGAGVYTLTATDGSLTPATSASLTIIPGTATKVAFSTQPVGGVTPGVALPTQPVVSVLDVNSNVVTSDTSSVTLAIASGPAGGTLSCTANPRSATAGVATFAGCRINGGTAAGSYTLTATDGALTSATSASFTINAGSLSFTTSPYGFAGVTLNGTDQNPTANLLLDVLDTTGAGAGWRMTASAAAWTGGTSGSLSSTQVAYAQPATPTCDGGAGTCTPAVPSGSVTWPTTLSSTPVVLYNASAATGLGPQTVTVPLRLPVPASVIATGTFTQTVTLTLTAGP